MVDKQIDSTQKKFEDNDEESSSMNEEEMIESTNQAKIIKDIEMKILKKDI